MGDNHQVVRHHSGLTLAGVVGDAPGADELAMKMKIYARRGASFCNSADLYLVV